MSRRNILKLAALAIPTLLFSNTKNKLSKVTVGKHGDYSTINEAILYLMEIYPKYREHYQPVIIELLSGFVMKEQIITDGIDLQWIKIVSNDSEVLIDHKYITQSCYSCGYPVFCAAYGGKLPQLESKFRMSPGAADNKHGILVLGAGSSVTIIKKGNGVVDAGGFGCFVLQGATATIRSADFSGAGKYGIYVSTAANVDAGFANVTNAKEFGMYCVAAYINAGSANASRAGVIGFYASEAAIINCAAVIADECGQNSFQASNGSTIYASGSFSRNQISSFPCAAVTGGSNIIITGLDTSGSTSPISNIELNTFSPPNGIIYN